MAERWGDSTVLYGDAGRLYGDTPFDFPRAQSISITIAGTDYTGYIFDDSIRIVEGDNPKLYFTMEYDGQASITDHDEVIVTDASQDRLFAGFLEAITSEHSRGPFFTYEVVAMSYAWLLDYPQKPITKVYEDSTADSAIIADIIDTYINANGVNEIDASTYVDTIETFAGKTYFENSSPRQVLDAIAKRTGGVYWIDFGPADAYKAYLHYTTLTTKDAPYELRDEETASPDYVTYFPYESLRRRMEHGVCTKVIVEGRPEIVAVTEKGGGTNLANGARTRFELPYRLIALQDEVRPLVWKYDGSDFTWQKVGYGERDSLGAADSDGYDVLWYDDYKYMEFYTAPPSNPGGHAFKYSAREVRPVTSSASDTASKDKYGREIVRRVRDENIYTASEAALLAAELLDRWKSSIDTYTCTAREPGLHRGQVIALTNANHALSAEELEIKELTARGTGGGYWAFDLELGKHVRSYAEIMREITLEKFERMELERSLGERETLGQIMFATPGTLTTATNADPSAPEYICAVNGLQITDTQASVITAPTGSSIVIHIFRYFSDPDHALYGQWWSIYTYGEEPTIAVGATDSTGGTLSTLAGRPWLREGDKLRMVIDSVGSGTAGADLTVSLKVRQ